MWMARARPLLGTVVSIQAHIGDSTESLVECAVAEAFSTMAHIGHVMSAHNEDSEIARMATANPSHVLTLDAHTVHVIRAAQYWASVSAGAFDPCGAAQTLSRQKMRPGLVGNATGSLDDIEILSETDVRLAQPVQLDFGGIAKGYAVDCAIDVLLAHGVRDAMVNAGGDMRAVGQRKWTMDVRHANRTLMDVRLHRHPRLHQQALATSVAGELNSEFVLSRTHLKPKWHSVTVQADTCMTADVLTKWAMQSSLLCPSLRKVLRLNRGRMWRTQ